MNKGCTCGCCEGVEKLTPLPTAHRPGLPALSYCVGTHATFLETMLGRLSSLSLEEPTEKLVADEHPRLEAMGNVSGASASEARKGDR